MNIRVTDCIDCYILMEEGLAYRFIIVLHLLGAD